MNPDCLIPIWRCCGGLIQGSTTYGPPSESIFRAFVASLASSLFKAPLFSDSFSIKTCEGSEGCLTPSSKFEQQCCRMTFIRSFIIIVCPSKKQLFVTIEHATAFGNNPRASPTLGLPLALIALALPSVACPPLGRVSDWDCSSCVTGDWHCLLQRLAKSLHMPSRSEMPAPSDKSFGWPIVPAKARKFKNAPRDSYPEDPNVLQQSILSSDDSLLCSYWFKNRFWERLSGFPCLRHKKQECVQTASKLRVFKGKD